VDGQRHPAAGKSSVCPAPISIPDGAPVDNEVTVKNDRPAAMPVPSSVSSSMPLPVGTPTLPRTLVEFPAPKIAMPAPAPAPAPIAAKPIVAAPTPTPQPQRPTPAPLPPPPSPMVLKPTPSATPQPPPPSSAPPTPFQTPSMKGPIQDADSSVPWTTMPAPDAAKIPDPRKL